MTYNQKIPPFKWFILENFPYIEEDFDALTNWQLFCKLGKEMNKIIEKTNLTGEQVEQLTTAFNELKAYIDDYFENLDVQEEINTKLDEMAEQGVLTDIIAQYLQLAGVLAYDTVADMKTAENLANGSFARTYGYYDVNDNGQAFYKIRKITNQDVVDDGSIIALHDTELVAELVTKEVTPEQFGAKGDGTTNDTTKINNAIQYCISKNKKLVFTNGKTYGVTNIVIDNIIDINFNNAKLKALEDSENAVLLITKNDGREFNIDRIYVDTNKKNVPYGVELRTNRMSIQKITCWNNINDGIYIGGNIQSDAIWISEIYVNGDNTTTGKAGVVLNANDVMIGKIEAVHFNYGINIIGAHNDIEINTIHAWSDISNSSCVKYSGSSFYGNYNSIIADSLDYAIDTSSVSGYGKLNVQNLMIFPKTTNANWKIVNHAFNRQTMGMTFGKIYGISDTDTTNRFGSDFFGTVYGNNNSNQKPTFSLQTSVSNSYMVFNQDNGFAIQTNYSSITWNGGNDVDLGTTNFIDNLWKDRTIHVICYNSNYVPFCFGLMNWSNGKWRIRPQYQASNTLTGKGLFKIVEPLPMGYSYEE